MLTTLFTLAAATATPAPATPADLAAIEATCFDYVDGQLEGDPERVKRALHPDLAKRRVLGDTPDERLGLQRMSREEALKSYTWNAAYAAKEEMLKGSLAVGKLADITVLTKDIMTVPEDEIPATDVVYTIVGGKVMYRGAAAK